MADVDISGVYESVGVAEDITPAFESFVSVYDAIALTEFADAIRDLWYLSETIAMWKLTAESGRTIQGECTLPTWSLSGQSGYRLNEKLPTAEIAGSMQADSISLTLDSVLPTWSVAGQAGFRLSEKVPLCEISASFEMSYILTLTKKIPLLQLSATMYEEGVFQLDQTMPARKLEATMNPSVDNMTLDVNIPGALKIAASMYEVNQFSLDRVIAARTLVASMYTGQITLDSNMPVWMMNAVLLDSKPSVSPDSNVTEDSFYGVLRYIRP